MSSPEVTALIPIHRTKGNREWLQQAVNSLKGAKILVLENDGEVIDSLNEGLKAADTEWVTAFGSDDIAHPNFLERSLAFTYGNDVVYPGLVLTDEELNIIGGGAPDPFNGRRLLDNNYIPGPSLYRREKALEVGGYRQLDGLEDWDLWVRMYRAGARFQNTDALVFYRIHPEGRNQRARQDESYREEMRRKIVGDPPAPAPATFYTQATPGTTYLRCQLPARHLGAYVYQDIMAMLHPEEQTVFPEHSGAAIFQFPGDKMRGASMALMREAGIRVLIEVDDNYLIHPGKKVLERSQWSDKIGDKPHSRQAHRFLTENAADGVIVTCRALRDAYAKRNPNVYICPNTVDPSDWPEPQKQDDGILRIGWVASRSHDVDIPLVKSAMEWASEQKDVEVYMVGLNPRFKFKHGFLPWMENLAALREVYQLFDVGLCPIKRIPFALYRSDVKALEYAMGGAVPVVSNVAPYEDWTEDRCYRVLVDKDWKKMLKHIVANRDEVKAKAQAAREYTLTERTTAAQIHCWEEAIATP